jgi:hypothetical protein
MTREPRRNVWPTIFAGSVILALVLDPLSFPPAHQLVIHLSARPGPDPEWPQQAYDAFYKPLFWTVRQTGTQEWSAKSMRWWFDE